MHRLQPERFHLEVISVDGSFTNINIRRLGCNLPESPSFRHRYPRKDHVQGKPNADFHVVRLIGSFVQESETLTGGNTMTHFDTGA